MSKHVPQPQLCPDCEILAHALAESGPPNDTVLKRCMHNRTIAIASKRNGIIVNWIVEGPVTDQQAHALAAKLLSGGAPVREFRRQ
jgi:hypothetical protein